MRKAMRREGLPPGRTNGFQSARGAPHVAQNLVLACTAEPHRAQAGPEPGAEPRRPQLGQNGCTALVWPPQKGQGLTSALAASVVPTLWVAGMRAEARPDPSAAAPPSPRTPSAALVRLATGPAVASGSPQAIQKSAPAPLSPPREVQVD